MPPAAPPQSPLPPNANDPATIRAMREDPQVERLRRDLYQRVDEYRYTYNFTWLGRPIIQTPEDMVALQEIIFATSPDLIIETGIAHGGSLIYSASILSMLPPPPNGTPARRVIGVDIDIRAHNRTALEAHPMIDRITLLEGSSTDPAIVQQINDIAAKHERIMVILDSNHTHEHVLAELRAYAPLVTAGMYLIVYDTGIEDMPEGAYPDRPWTKDANPKTAVRAYLGETNRFELDRDIEAKILFTAAPEGFLRCTGE